jgi:hypothetical protein
LQLLRNNFKGALLGEGRANRDETDVALPLPQDSF